MHLAERARQVAAGVSRRPAGARRARRRRGLPHVRNDHAGAPCTNDLSRARPPRRSRGTYRSRPSADPSVWLVVGPPAPAARAGVRRRRSGRSAQGARGRTLGRRAPRGQRPFVEPAGAVHHLDPGCGDHKIIWELNRHQHWEQLGRAWWLTGDRRYRTAVIEQLASWLHANPPLVGINWTSMLELGLRSLSWLWTLNFFADPAIDDRLPWTIDLVLALDRQLTHVERNLSYYFSPNTHLLGEALALY